MLRTAAKAFSASRIIAASTPIFRQSFHIPAISPKSPNLTTGRSKTSLLFFPSLLAHYRGYAPGRGAPNRPVSDDDEDLSDDDMDSENFGIGGQGFDEDDDEGILDEDDDDEDDDDGVEDDSD